jgi:hypothetical protein
MINLNINDCKFNNMYIIIMYITIITEESKKFTSLSLLLYYILSLLYINIYINTIALYKMYLKALILKSY